MRESFSPTTIFRSRVSQLLARADRQLTLVRRQELGVRADAFGESVRFEKKVWIIVRKNKKESVSHIPGYS